MENADLSSLREKYEAHLLNRGKEVCVLDPKGEWRGVARGIDRNGRLLIEQTGSGDEGLRAVDSGEVSVRGVYGYV